MKRVLVTAAGMILVALVSYSAGASHETPLASAQSQTCPTQSAIVCVALTVTPGASPTLAATPTVTASATAGTPAQATPTIIRTPLPGTNVPATPFCAWEAQGAQAAQKQTYYTYTEQRYGIQQNVRSGPGTDFLIIEYLNKGAKVRVYWWLSRGGFKWWALDVKCTRWAAELGTIEEVLN
jgi:hypothetical protein